MARPVGSKNKPKRLLAIRLAEMYGEDFNPVVKMAGNAVNLQKIADNAIEGMEKAVELLTSEFTSDDDIDTYRKSIVQVSVTAGDAINAWDRVAQYVQPKMKTIEHTGADGEPLDTNWTVEFVNATPPKVDPNSTSQSK